ncbi:MAG: hypothetical protein ABJA66_19240 [Actinomycetota bacterium]
MKNKIIKTIVVICALLGGASWQIAAQPKQVITRRVALTNAKPCMILTGAAQPKNFDTYIFRARKGQTIVAAPFYYGRETNRPDDDEQGSSGFDFVSPDGKSIVDPQDVIFEAVRTGEYKILIRPAYRRTTGKYVLKLSVTNKQPKISDNLDKPPTCP